MLVDGTTKDQESKDKLSNRDKFMEIYEQYNSEETDVSVYIDRQELGKIQAGKAGLIEFEMSPGNNKYDIKLDPISGNVVLEADLFIGQY